MRDLISSEPARLEHSTVGDGDAAGVANRKPFASYPGSKDAAGAAERIVGVFPMHSVYVEPFVGGGACYRRKCPALRSVLIDLDPEVVTAWRKISPPGATVLQGDGIAWLSREGPRLPSDALVYADPPYPRSTRSRRRLYRCEMTDRDHRRLLAAVVGLRCSVVVSSYPNRMYEKALSGPGWLRMEFPAMTRGGVRTEVVWWRSTIAGFADATRYAGRDYRERERIKRKAARWAAKFRAMPEAERGAVFAALQRAHAAGIVGPGGEGRTGGTGGEISASELTMGPQRQS